MALPVYFAQSNMVNACLPPVQTMLTGPALGMHHIYVAIKQLVATAHKLHLSAEPSKRAIAIHVANMIQEAGY